jgi:membrane protein required for colicin V production
MTFVDILIWGILLAFMVKGFTKGLVREVCALLGLVAGAWAAFKYYPALAEAIRPLIRLPHAASVVISFVLIYIVMGLLFYLFGHLLTVVLKIMLLGGVNRIGGIIFGGLEGAFLLCILLALATSKPVPDRVKAQLQRSRTAQSFSAAGRDIIQGWETRSRMVH